MKFGFRIFLPVVLLCPALLFFATRPALNSTEWPPDDIIVSDNSPSQTSNLTPNTFSVVTYNIGYASGQKNNKESFADKSEMMMNLDEITASLKKTDADVIALQEVDFNAARTFHVNQMDWIANALHIPYRAYVTTWNMRYVPFPYWPIKNQFGSIVSGQCLLSRNPIVEQTLHRFDKPSSNPFWYNWFYLDRVMQQVRIQIGDQIATVWNVHLEAFDQQSRQEQALFIAQTVRNDSNVLKFALGDFNSASFVMDPKKPQHEQETIKLFERESGLKNAETSEKLFTIPSWNPTEKIDHIFIPPNFSIESVDTVSSTASDHLPVWVAIHANSH